MAKLMGARWASLRPEEHIWQFTHETLGDLVGRSGFREFYFESKENYKPNGWGPKELVRRVLNYISIVTNQSESMLLFAAKMNMS
jgi:hypothetical protein